MATILDLQDRGLRYGVIVDAAATTATLAAIERAGLRYKVEVASGITAADRAAMDRRGLQYFVPVSATVSMADRAILERQGLRYAVQVDPTVISADLAALERQGLSYFVEVDSSGTAIATAAGGAILLVDEANGFATDFTYATDASRVAVKTAGTVVASTVDGFFTNAGTSPKMVYDVAGTLGWSPHNILTRSEDVTDATWQLTNLTAPSAARLAETAATGGHNVRLLGTAVSVAGMPYCFWCEATAAECDRIMLYGLNLGGYGLGFDLTTGTTFAPDGISSAGLVNSGILALGSGRYRCWIALNAGGVDGTPGLYLCNGTAFSYVGNTSRGLTIHRQQLNRGTVPTAYLPTTTAARYGLALDYDPVTHAAKGLLVEPAATNSCLQSAVGRSGFVWSGNGATVTGGQSDPSGGSEAANVVVTNVAAGNNISKNISPLTPADYIGSMWLKGTLGQQIYFNINSDTAASQVLVTFTGAWQRVTSLGTSLSSATIGCETYNRGGGSHLPGVTFQCWGAQIEVGTVATSYIPTTTATVTRAADQPFFLLNTIPAISTEITLYGRWQTPSPASNRFAFCVTDSLGVPGDYAGLFASTSARLTVADGTATQATIVAGTIVANTSLSIAGRSKANDFSASMNGAAVVTDVTGTQPTGLTHVRFGNTGGNAAATARFYVEKMVILPRGMSNAELVVRSAT